MPIWRRRAVPAALDQLLLLPSAAGVVEARLGFTPTGVGSICFRKAEESAFRDVLYDVRDWLNRDFGATLPVEITDDSHGYTWIVIHRPPDQIELLVTELHAASCQLADNGLGRQLLCSLVAFRDKGERHVAVVYLYKRRTFYPFAPQTGESRDNRLEIAFSAAIKEELPFEADLGRWFPVWSAPGL